MIYINNKRRAKLTDVTRYLITARSKLEGVIDEESDAMENIPENLQSSERYEKIEDIVDALEEVSEELDELIDKILEIKSQ